MQVIAWSFYDWANSVYPLVMTTAIFPIFYKNATPDFIFFVGLNFTDTELFTYINCLSFILVALFSPILGGIADHQGNRKSFMKFFTYLGSLSCMGLFFFGEIRLFLCILLILFASIGYWASTVFYNSYLPSLVPAHRYDSISARGYILGYLGSCLLLTLCLWWIFSQGLENTKYCFIFVGLWWAGFAQFSFYYLPKTDTHVKKNEKNVFLTGYQTLHQTWREIRGLGFFKEKNTQIIPFLWGFFAYSIGIQTFLLIASLFAQKELHIPETNLVISILLIQIVGLLGSFLFARISKKFGNIKALTLGLSLWTILCLWVYFLSDPQNLEPRILEFYIISAIVGLIMGGTQSLSRSTYSKLIPKNSENLVSYFSFYDVTEKWSIAIGTFFWAFLEGCTGSMYSGLLFISSLLILGMVGILRVPNIIFLNQKKNGKF